MSCYTRHLGELMELLGMEVTKENKRLLDERIRKALDMDGPCPEVWKKVKEMTADAGKRDEFLAMLK